jgi:hypothetical protein
MQPKWVVTPGKQKKKLIYLAFVIYVLKDGHMIDRNIQECTVCEKRNLEYLCAFVVTITLLYI